MGINFIVPNNRQNSLREKCQNKEFFLVRIFLHSDYEPEKTPY